MPMMQIVFLIGCGVVIGVVLGGVVVAITLKRYYDKQMALIEKGYADVLDRMDRLGKFIQDEIIRGVEERTIVGGGKDAE